MGRSQRILTDGEGAFEDRLGLFVAALVLIDGSQIVETGGDIGMVRPQRLLADRQGALKQWLGLAIAVLRAQ
jgi:hypothetical protein